MARSNRSQGGQPSLARSNRSQGGQPSLARSNRSQGGQPSLAELRRELFSYKSDHNPTSQIRQSGNNQQSQIWTRSSAGYPGRLTPSCPPPPDNTTQPQAQLPHRYHRGAVSDTYSLRSHMSNTNLGPAANTLSGGRRTAGIPGSASNYSAMRRELLSKRHPVNPDIGVPPPAYDTVMEYSENYTRDRCDTNMASSSQGAAGQSGNVGAIGGETMPPPPSYESLTVMKDFL